MNLLQLDESHISTVTSWLVDDRNAIWLDFGGSTSEVTLPLVKYMVLKETNAFRVFTDDLSDEPIGVVALSNIHQKFHSAMLWFVLGDKTFSNRNCTTRAVSQMIRHGFDKLQLHSIHTWTVAINYPSIRVLEKNNFILTGRQRQCHIIEGEYCDRLLYDLMVNEYGTARRV